MILSVLIILIIFSGVLAAVWAWFFKNEKAFCEKLYNLGETAFESKKYKNARTFFLKTIQLLPNFKEVQYKLGLTHLALEEYDLAIECFSNVLKATPKHFDALYHQALAFQGALDYAKAETAYNTALIENAKSGDCLFGLGFICYKQEKYEEALEFFEKAQETYLDKVTLAFYINKCHDALSSYEEDEQGLEIINGYLKISREPNLPKEFDISLATAYAKAGQIEPALVYCKKALLVAPEDIESYKLLGLIQLVQQNFVATKNTISTALHLQPNNPELHNILSYVLCQQIDNCELNHCRERYHQLIEKFLN